MNKENHLIDDLFAGKLRQLEATPSDDAWNKLQGRLQQQKKSKRGIIWWPYLSAAAVALLVISILLVNRQTEKPGVSEIAHTSPNKPDHSTRDAAKLGKEDAADTAQQTANPAHAVETEAPEAVAVPMPDARQAEQPIATRNPAQKLQKQQNSVKVLDSLPVPTEEQILVKQKTDILDTAATHENTLFIVVQLAEEATAAADDKGEIKNGSRKAEKFLSQLKKVKKGEFKELGIDANQILAFVKDKTDREKEEPVNK